MFGLGLKLELSSYNPVQLLYNRKELMYGLRIVQLSAPLEF